jgi:DNA polymerase III epsilon subunit-like protein
MKFIKDILFFELITTGNDTDKDNILQLSAIVLDKDNLLEKGFFNSYVRVSYLDNVIWEHSKLLRIPPETLKKSPKVYDAIKQFHKLFGKQYLLATHNLTNLLFLKIAFKKALVSFDYDSHVLDLWTLGYIFTLNFGLKKMPTANTFFDYFKFKQKNPYDALEKVRLEAEVFRKIIKQV